MVYNKDIDAIDNTKGNPRHMYVDCGMGLLRFSIKAIHTPAPTSTQTHTHPHTYILSHTHTHTFTHIFATFMKFAAQNVGQLVKLSSGAATQKGQALIASSSSCWQLP